MSQDDAPQRIAVIWSPEARADLRAIDRETALQILYCLDHYLASRSVPTTASSSSPKTRMSLRSQASVTAKTPIAKPPPSGRKKRAIPSSSNNF